jgi:hypothetical protein
MKIFSLFLLAVLAFSCSKNEEEENTVEEELDL